MIRPRKNAKPASCSKPRASGDDPQADGLLIVNTVVNPARAGMIRHQVNTGTHMSSKPRASGDDPTAHFTVYGKAR